MMGRQPKVQNKLFYTAVNLEQRVRKNHILRAVKSYIDFDFIYNEVKDKYGINGNESVPWRVTAPSAGGVSSDLAAQLNDHLTAAFAGDDSKQAQWVAFMRRSKLGEEGLTLKEVVEFLAEFLQPPLEALRAGESFGVTWPPGGPWQTSRAE